MIDISVDQYTRENSKQHDDYSGDMTRIVHEIYEVTPAVIYLLDLKTGIPTFYNSSVEDIMIYTREEMNALQEKYIETVFHPEELEMVLNRKHDLEKLLDSETLAFECRVRRKDGKYIWITTSEKVYERDEQGVPIKIIGIGQENTKQKKDEEEIKELNKFLGNILSFTPGIVYVLDLKTRATESVFQTGIGPLGYTSEEYMALKEELITKVIHPGDLEKMDQKFNRIQDGLKDDETITVEYRAYHKNGDLKWMTCTDRVFERDEHGNPTKVIGIALEITKEIENRKKIEDLNSFLTQIIKVSPGIIYIFNLDNYQLEDIFQTDLGYSGYSEEEMVGMENNLMTNMVHPDDMEKVGQQLYNLKHNVSDNELIEREMRMIDKEGKIIWITTTDKVFERNAKGEATKIIGIAQETTLQKKAELQMASDKEMFEALYKLSAFEQDDFIGNLENILCTICQNLDMEIGMIGKADEECYEIIAIHGEDENFNKGARNHLKETLCKLTIQKGNLLILDDLSLDPELSLHPFKTALNITFYIGVPLKIKNKVFGTLAFMRRKEIDNPLSETRENLLRTFGNWISKIMEKHFMQKELENTVQELQQANEELERFAYIASHDLKEPLNTIIGLTELLKMDIPEDEGIRQILHLLENSTGRMKDLITDLLSHSILNRQILSIKKLNLNILLEEVMQDLKGSIKEKNATLQFGELPEIYGDTTQIKQLFQNLISNAIKFVNGSQPIIKVEYKEEIEDWIFAINDNGIGIAKDDQGKIFEVFKKLHNKQEYTGTGIGLANCKRIVHNHNGKIWVDSELTKGTTFYFSIPKNLPST